VPTATIFGKTFIDLIFKTIFSQLFYFHFIFKLFFLLLTLIVVIHCSCICINRKWPIMDKLLKKMDSLDPEERKRLRTLLEEKSDKKYVLVISVDLTK